MRTIATVLALMAAIWLNTAAAQQQQLTGTSDFCIKGATGPIKCDYQTMAQCQERRPQGSADQCLQRSQVQGTVGGPASPARREQPNAPGEQKD